MLILAEYVGEIITAALAGLFSLAGVVLNQYLSKEKPQRRARRRSTGDEQESDAPDATDWARLIIPLLPRLREYFLAHSRRFPLLLWILVFPYTAFQVMVIATGKGDDVEAGLWQLSNAFVLAAGSVWATVDYRFSRFVPLVAAGVQLVVLVVMLTRDIGDAIITVPYNLIVAFIFLVVAAFYWKRASSDGRLERETVATRDDADRDATD